MKNVILSMLIKMSRMDAQMKELTAQIEAQSLIVAALTLTVGKGGGLDEMVASINKSINSVLETPDAALQSDAELLLVKFHEQVELTRAVSKESDETPAVVTGDDLTADRPEQG
ncbi:anti-adapter protein IraP [Kosakonia cowanii]